MKIRASATQSTGAPSLISGRVWWLHYKKWIEEKEDEGIGIEMEGKRLDNPLIEDRLDEKNTIWIATGSQCANRICVATHITWYRTMEAQSCFKRAGMVNCGRRIPLPVSSWGSYASVYSRSKLYFNRTYLSQKIVSHGSVFLWLQNYLLYVCEARGRLQVIKDDFKIQHWLG